MRGAHSVWVLVALGLAACTGLQDAAPVSTSSSAGSPSVSSTAAARTWTGEGCLIRQPSASLAKQIFTEWRPPASAGVEDVIPMSAPSAEGWMAVDQHGSKFTGVMLWNVRTNESVEVHRFEHPENPNTGKAPADQAFGGFDGRYLVFKVAHTPYAPNDYFSTYLFDLKTKKLTHLGDNGAGADGRAFPSPADEPFIVGDYGVWMEGKNEKDSQIALVKLSTGKVNYLFRKTTAKVQAYRGKLLADEYVKNKLHRTLLSVPDGKESAVPPIIKSREDQDWVHVANGGAVVYADEDLTSLWYSPDGVVPAQRVPAPKGADFSDAFTVTDEAVLGAMQGPGSSYIDTSTGRGVIISSSQFFQQRGHVAATIDANDDKGAPNTVIRLVDIKPGQLPACESLDRSELGDPSAEAEPVSAPSS